jgi:hypothetical protein
MIQRGFLTLFSILKGLVTTNQNASIEARDTRQQRKAIEDAPTEENGIFLRDSSNFMFCALFELEIK